MSITPYPNGISSWGMPVLPRVGDIVTTGSVFFVHSGTGSNGNSGTDPDNPYADIDYAIGQCTANKGDVIYVMPGHADTISAAGDITLDVAGVSIIGLGNGSLRPIITYDTADTGILNVTGANCTIDNIIFSANFADIVMAIDVDAVDFTISRCSFRETATDKNFFSCIGTDDTNNAADGLSVLYCERISIDANVLAFISILANISRLKVIGNFDNQASAADIGHFIILGTFTVLGAEIIGNRLNVTGDDNASTVGIFMTGSSTSCTGIMAYNLAGSLDTTTELIVTATLDFQQFENYFTGVIAKSGKLWPAVDGA